MIYKIVVVVKPGWLDKAVGFFNKFETKAEAETMAFGLTKVFDFPGIEFCVEEVKNESR